MFRLRRMMGRLEEYVFLFFISVVERHSKHSFRTRYRARLSTLPFVFRLLNYANVGNLIYCETFRELKFTGGPSRTVSERETKTKITFSIRYPVNSSGPRTAGIFSGVQKNVRVVSRISTSPPHIVPWPLRSVRMRNDVFFGSVRFWTGLKNLLEKYTWRLFEIDSEQQITNIVFYFDIRISGVMRLGYSNGPRSYSYQQGTYYFYLNEYSYVIWIPKSSLRMYRFREISNEFAPTLF